ncbi:MAG: hypothetical protein EA369_00800 [Bradymonadales bacterium]|nr:MAG: hypothetical protein EA369_00800 [Bradymonadales bacterium]
MDAMRPVSSRLVRLSKTKERGYTTASQAREQAAENTVSKNQAADDSSATHTDPKRPRSDDSFFRAISQQITKKDEDD